MLPNRSETMKLSDITTLPYHLQNLDESDSIDCTQLIFKYLVSTYGFQIELNIKTEKEAIFLLEKISAVSIHASDTLKMNQHKNAELLLCLFAMLASVICKLCDLNIFKFQSKSRVSLKAVNDIYTGYKGYCGPEGYWTKNFPDAIISYHSNFIRSLYNDLYAQASNKIPADASTFALVKKLFSPDKVSITTLEDCLDPNKFSRDLLERGFMRNIARDMFIVSCQEKLGRCIEAFYDSIQYNSPVSASASFYSSLNNSNPTLFKSNDESKCLIADSINNTITSMHSLYTKIQQLELDSNNEAASRHTFKPL